MPPKIISKDLLKEIAPQNKEWFDKYRTKTPNYYANVQEFLEFCAFKNDKFISQLGRNDIDLYIATLKDCGARPNTINRRLSALSGFGNFLHTNYPDTFDKNFFSDKPSHEKIKEINPKEIQALDLKQLHYIREYNHRSVKSAKDEYIFELFYQLGITEEELLARQFPEPRNKQVDEIIKKVPKGVVKKGTIDSYLIRITNELIDKKVYDKTRKISSYDLTESHKAYFFQCPNCKLFFENISKNWVLVRMESDQDYRLFCFQCKGMPNENRGH